VSALNSYYSGLSGLQLPIAKYQYPPGFQDKSRLTYYSTLFNSIEINSSFYKIPMRATVARWSSSVPDNFRFTFKLFRQITHNKELVFEKSDVEKFMETIGHIGTKRGCLLVQFPPGLKNENIHQLESLLANIAIADPDKLWNVVVEFRDRGWYNEDVYEILRMYGASLVAHDLPKSATPLEDLSQNIVYVRFHGPTGNYRGSYTDAFLLEYAEYINQWLREGRSVYVYFNNTAGDAFNNLKTLNALLK
jgi:uncharacterized protein YecE (DUF72 family)